MATPFQWQTFTPDESYEAVYQHQKDLVTARLKDAISDTLLLGEHPPVITMGRKPPSQPEMPGTSSAIPVIEIERGGEATYHGPGQLVGYPIFKLQPHEQDLHRYLRNLEEVLIRTLANLGLEATRKPGWTGVWVGDLKIASIGVAVKQWVTYHGFALNIATNLTEFQAINPCGLTPETMTSAKALLPHELYELCTIKHFQPWVLVSLAEVFQRDIINP